MLQCYQGTKCYKEGAPFEDPWVATVTSMFSARANCLKHNVRSASTPMILSTSLKIAFGCERRDFWAASGVGVDFIECEQAMQGYAQCRRDLMNRSGTAGPHGTRTQVPPLLQSLEIN